MNLDSMLNKIHHADTYEFVKSMPDDCVDCVYIDIPYEMQNGGKGAGAFGDKVRKLLKNDADNLIHGIDYSIFNELKRILKKINIFIWCNKQQVKHIMNFFKDYSMEILVWCKNNPSPFTNNVWLSDIEYCLYFREEGVLLNDGYELKSKWYLSPTNKRDKENFKHPTIKPLELVERHLRHATRPGDVVFDGFSGSGTTAVACLKNDRNYICVEKVKRWVNISRDRTNCINAKGQYSMFTV